ncbi:MAG: sulfite exporter TauE/SafE family protein [Candidatus Aminicenantia bacterium]
MGDFDLILVPIFFIISFFYSSVGLGGGSSYVAFLSFNGFPLNKIPPIALFLNIIVASIALYRFKKVNFFDFRLVLPFVVSSIPAAFIGARVKLDEKSLSILFAVIIFLVAVKMLSLKKEITPEISVNWKTSWLIGLPGGVILGFTAGVVGIGGGIFLGPVLLLFGFASSKQTAAACSTFVLLNSISGLLSHIIKGGVDILALLPFGTAVFLGGQIGSYFGAKKFSPLILQKIFGSIILLIAIKVGMRVVL